MEKYNTLDEREACRLLHLPPNSLQTHLKSGAIHLRKVGGVVYLYCRTSLRQWIDENWHFQEAPANPYCRAITDEIQQAAYQRMEEDTDPKSQSILEYLFAEYERGGQ